MDDNNGEYETDNNDYGNELSDDDVNYDEDNEDNEAGIDNLETENENDNENEDTVEEIVDICEDINEIRRKTIDILNNIVNNLNKTKIIEESIFRFACSKNDSRKVIKSGKIQFTEKFILIKHDLYT